MERELSPREQEILNYIREHPGLTPEDIAGHFGDTVEDYRATYYLISTGKAAQNEANYAVYARV